MALIYPIESHLSKLDVLLKNGKMQREIYGSKNYASFGIKWFDELNQGETIRILSEKQREAQRKGLTVQLLRSLNRTLSV